jgi:tripartite-type tricarboxylate transporter receptor subunit TctC
MKSFRSRFQDLAAVAAAVVLSAAPAGDRAWSQTSKIIKIVVPYAPGGANDILARLLGEQIGRAGGPRIVIENRVGASGVIAAEAVLRTAPDGTTLLTNSNTSVIIPHFRKLNYNPLTSFEPICYLASSPLIVAVNSASSYRTLADLLNAARTKPGSLTIASTGPASSLHIGVEMLKRTANVNITYVPYLGGPPAVIALLGEHVTSVFETYPSVAEQLKAGTLRALAIASRARTESLPDVPTIAESGYENFEAEGWYGVVAPAGTSKETVSQLAGWFKASLQVSEVKAKLAIQGLYPVGMCGTDFGAFIRKQSDAYGPAIREANIKAE